ncbi:hypothetical protein JCM10213_001943 [Rhodosporidiobolus nylandii]
MTSFLSNPKKAAKRARVGVVPSMQAGLKMKRQENGYWSSASAAAYSNPSIYVQPSTPTDAPSPYFDTAASPSPSTSSGAGFALSSTAAAEPTTSSSLSSATTWSQAFYAPDSSSTPAVQSHFTSSEAWASPSSAAPSDYFIGSTPPSQSTSSTSTRAFAVPSYLAVVSPSSSDFTSSTSSTPTTSTTRVPASYALVVASPTASSAMSLPVDSTESSSNATPAPSSTTVFTPLSAVPSASDTVAPRRASAATSFFRNLGSTPGNIALTSLVCAGILAVLLGVLAFFIRRCHRRRKKELLGDLLGTEGGASPKEDWAEKYADFEGHTPTLQIGGQPAESPGFEPDEVWRRRLTLLEDNAVAVAPVSMAGVGAQDSSEGARRASDETVGTDILYPSRAASFTHDAVIPGSSYLSFPLPPHRSFPDPSHLQPPPSRPSSYPLDPNLSANSASQYSTRSPTPLSPSFAPVYQRQPAAPLSPPPASYPSEVLLQSTSSAPVAIRTERAESTSPPTQASWRDSLNWAMGSAAGLVSSALGGRTASGNGSDEEKGDFGGAAGGSDRFTTFPRRQPSMRRDEGAGYGTLPRSRSQPLDLDVLPPPSAAENDNRTSFPSTTSHESPTSLSFPAAALLHASRQGQTARENGSRLSPSPASANRFEPVPFEQRRPSASSATENPFAPPRPPRQKRSIRHMRRASLELPYSAGAVGSGAMARQRSSSFGGRYGRTSPFDNADEESLCLSSDDEEEGELERMQRRREQENMVGSLMRDRRRRSMAPPVSTMTDEEKREVEKAVFSDMRV